MDLNLFPQNIYSSFVGEGQIYFFHEDCPVGIKNHPHICLKRGNKIFFFAVISSQIQKIPLWLRNPAFKPSGFPVILKSSSNQLEKDSYVNCNNPYEISEIELEDLLKNKYITPWNTDASFSEEEFNLVMKGVMESDLVPQNIKDLISS